MATKFNKTFFGLAGASGGSMDSFVTEATDIGLHNNDCNRDWQFYIKQGLVSCNRCIDNEEVR